MKTGDLFVAVIKAGVPSRLGLPFASYTFGGENMAGRRLGPFKAKSIKTHGIDVQCEQFDSEGMLVKVNRFFDFTYFNIVPAAPLLR